MDLDPRCRQVIEDATTAWQQYRDGKGTHYHARPGDPLLPPQTLNLQVQGHATEAAPPDANDCLSALRAEAMANELIRLGVPSRYVTSVGLGSSNPLVPGIPLDPQNCHALIVWKP